MAKEKRSFESALASILEELDLSFSLKVEQEYALKSMVCYGLLPRLTVSVALATSSCSDWS